MQDLGIAIAVVLAAYVMSRWLRSLLLSRTVLPTRQAIVHEYWIWSPVVDLPQMVALHRRLIQYNPYNQGEEMALSTSEGLLLSDIRLHIGISTRAKNPHVFSPQFFSDEAKAPVGAVEAMEKSQALMIARFASEQPMPDRGYIHFLTHLADALADYAKADLIYDREGLRFWTREEWKALMMRDNARPDLDKHYQVHAVEEPSGWWIHTHGLRKYGLPDLEMIEVSREQRTACTDIIRQMAERAIADPSTLSDGEVEYYGRQHRVVLVRGERGKRHHRGLVLGVVDTTSIIDQITYEQ